MKKFQEILENFEICSVLSKMTSLFYGTVAMETNILMVAELDICLLSKSTLPNRLLGIPKAQLQSLACPLGGPFCPGFFPFVLDVTFQVFLLPLLAWVRALAEVRLPFGNVNWEVCDLARSLWVAFQILGC